MTSRDNQADTLARSTEGMLDERTTAYISRVCDAVAWQVFEAGGACPAFLTIPEPADQSQSNHVKVFLEQWARERFGRSAPEIRIDHAETVQ
jgi:hypothetical protein